MNEQELESLMDALLDNELTEADLLRLDAEMQLRPEARRLYYDKLKLDTLLGIEAEQAAAEATLPPPSRERNWRPVTIAAAAAIALLASGVSGWFIGKRPAPTTAVPAATEPVAVGFGAVTEADGVVWQGETPVINRGDLLPPGELGLASGRLKLELFSGVKVIIEGEAQFELLSAMEMTVTRGKVRALVPEPAQGFRIHTPNGELVDLGTEFSVEVTAGHSDLHVLEGEVEWHPPSADTRSLKEGEAVRWGADGQATEIPIETGTIEDLEDAFEHQRQKRRSAWLEQVERHRADPRVIAYFPMHQQGPWKRTLTDESDHAHHATIVQAQRVADRWNTNACALDFSPTGSRARLVVPGIHGSLTFICWARIDSLDRQYNSLFLTDGHEVGEPHWQIMNDGRLFFSVKKRDQKRTGKPDKHIYFSPPIWDPTMSGRWMQIATTYDLGAKLVCHYIDGEQVSSEAIREDFLVSEVVIGAASIGNWSEPKRSDPSFAVRNLNGAVDEFTIYGEALGAEEIARLYQIGKP